MMTGAVLPRLLLLSMLLAGTAMAAEETEAPQEILVIGLSSLPAGGIGRDKNPASVQSLTSGDLERAGAPQLLQALESRADGVGINDAAGDPFQADLLYRGFAASPMLGTPQGIAVYLNGIRLNEAFGDTVNWDLVPDLAVERLDLVSTNPVYGLNALGGSLVLRTKTGFTTEGGDAAFSSGSFGLRDAHVEWGGADGPLALYLAGRELRQGSFRQYSSDLLRQFHADAGLRAGSVTGDFIVSLAQDRLAGAGPAPEQELALSRSLVFTTPQSNRNAAGTASLSASWQAGSALSVQALFYDRHFHQSLNNGNTTSDLACRDGNGSLCQPDGVTPLLGPGDRPIPDLSAVGTRPIGENDREATHAATIGTTVQAHYEAVIGGWKQTIVLGVSDEASRVDFQSSAEMGILSPSLVVQPSGYFVETPEGGLFNATPVSLQARLNRLGAFFTDAADLSESVTATVSGRWNLSTIRLSDGLGSALSGDSRYSGFDPAFGLTWRLAAGLSAYADVAHASRTPTPSEIECSDPARPCLLPSSLASDPPTLKMVTSRNVEAGLRGAFDAVSWHAGIFRNDLANDIYGVATSLGSGFFENVGATRRQGAEAGLSIQAEAWSGYVGASLTDATFRAPLVLPSPNNPRADAQGDIHVRSGDRLPGIPRLQMKFGIDYDPGGDLSIGLSGGYFSARYLRGDEADLTPPLPGYRTLEIHGRYRLSEACDLFAAVRNPLNEKYATFGQFGDPTGIGTPGVPAKGPVSTRFLSPAAPITVSGGVQIRF